MINSNCFGSTSQLSFTSLGKNLFIKRFLYLQDGSGKGDVDRAVVAPALWKVPFFFFTFTGRQTERIVTTVVSSYFQTLLI